jgi:transposase InsO family protein
LTHGDATMALFDYIEVFYNQRRRHSTLGRISPSRSNVAPIKRVWTLRTTAQDAVSHRTHTRRLLQEHKNARRRAVSITKLSTESDQAQNLALRHQAAASATNRDS